MSGSDGMLEALRAQGVGTALGDGAQRGECPAESTGRPYRAPERCVELHAVLMECYEVCCAALWGRDGREAVQRFNWNLAALDGLARLHGRLGDLMRCDPVYLGPNLGGPVEALLVDARAYAQSCRRYLLPEHADALHMTLTELWRVACLRREAMDLGAGDRRKALYRKVLDALAAMQPQVVGLVITPGTEVAS